MMDYAGRVRQADTYPKLLRLNAREHGSDVALREKDLGLWRRITWADYHTRVRDFALGMVVKVVLNAVQRSPNRRGAPGSRPG